MADNGYDIRRADLERRNDLEKMWGIVCSFAGVFIVITRGDFLSLQFGNALGIFSAVAGAVVFGLFSVLGKKQNYEKFTSVTLYYLFSIPYTLIAIMLFSEIPQISIYQLAGLLWLGIFISGLAFVLWFLALKYGDTAKMSNIIFLTPFISLVYIYFLVGEKILISSVAGLVVIVAGILIQSVNKKSLLLKTKT